MDYDIGKAFEAIEEELIASMMRNMQRHRDWEDDEGFHWSMWQAEQLKALEQYKRTNKKKFERQFNEINGYIRILIEQAREQGGMDQELEILDAIANGWKPPKRISKYMDTSAEFFKLNTRKLEALIKATENDFKRAEVAMLRMADDQYRKVIFNAQVYANTGAATYEKAVDMATKDYLSRGINCIEYSNGARHTMRDYAEMAIRTAAKRAYLAGEGEKRQEWGIHTVIVHKRGNPCPLCLPFVGKVLIDDVWSGGSSAGGQKYPLMSSAVDAGLYHPRCKDTHSTYFEGISEPPDNKFTKGEIADIEERYRQDQKQNYIDRQIEKYERLEENSLDEENKETYRNKKNTWESEKVALQATKSNNKGGNINNTPNPVVIGGVNCTKATSVHGFSDGTGRNSFKTVDADVYTTPDGTKFVFPKNYDKAHQHMTPEIAIRCWQRVPQSIKVKAQKTIEFVDYYNPQDSYWRQKYKNFGNSYATGGDKITFYRYDNAHNEDYVVRTYCHEAGHYIDTSMATTAGRFCEEPTWTKAMADDKIVSGKASCTAYGANSNVEDFAESIAEYVKDPVAFAKDFPNRAAIIAGFI